VRFAGVHIGAVHYSKSSAHEMLKTNIQIDSVRRRPQQYTTPAAEPVSQRFTRPGGGWAIVKREKAKLNESAVRQIRTEWTATPQPNAEKLGKKYGVSVSTIKAVLSRKTWKNVE
jgi:hypothetical protein